MQDILTDADVSDPESILKFFNKELATVSNLLVNGRIIQAHNDVCRLRAQIAKGHLHLNELKESTRVDE